MTDVYQNWRDRLAGKDVPTYADHPDPGYYKVRDGRDGPWKPCAIWPVNGELVCRVGPDTRDPVVTWSFAAKNPIAKDAAKFAFDNGYFPDEPKPAVRSNMPADPFEALIAEMEDKAAQADDLLKSHPEIKTQLVCDLARNLQAQLLDINKRADAMHEDAKRPILDKGREVDERFRFRAAVKVLSERLRQRFGAFLAVEERRQREEAERRHREETARVEAERKRIAEERAKLEEDEPIAFLTSPAPELPEMPPAPGPVKVQAGGGFGRKAGLRSVWVPVMTDYKAALAHFAENAKLKELVQKLGEQAVKAGARDIPGFEIKEERRAA